MANLRRLGPTLTVLENALSAGAADAAMTTAHSPATAYGSRFWEGVIRELRDELAPARWSVERPGQLEVVRRADNKVQLTAALGDAYVGDPSATPSCEHPRGKATADAIDRNQGSLEALAPDDDAWQPIETWWLLYRLAGSGESKRVVAELSLPIEMRGSRISWWHTRLVLPELPLGDGGARLELPPPPPEINPEVRRRAV